MSNSPSFADLASARDPRMDLLALAIAGEFREVDADAAVAALDALGAELAQAATETGDDPEEVAHTCARVLGKRHGFRGDSDNYDHPDNSMLDLVLARRRGLPILLSVVYIEVARRAEIPIGGVGTPGHFVVAHFGRRPPLLMDPFRGGVIVGAGGGHEVLRPSQPHEIAMRMLNNLLGSYERRANLTAAIRAASMRLALPAEPALKTALRAELLALQARLN